jgi:hypothetical protein
MRTLKSIIGACISFFRSTERLQPKERAKFNRHLSLIILISRVDHIRIGRGMPMGQLLARTKGDFANDCVDRCSVTGGGGHSD